MNTEGKLEEDRPFIRSALDWPTNVPELRGLKRDVPMATQHRLWQSVAQQGVYQFLTVFEIIPLTRLSRTHMSFIENELRSHQLLVGPRELWKTLPTRCRWYKSWIVRSLPWLQSILFTSDQGIEILYAILLRPPPTLHSLQWCLISPFRESPSASLHATFPSLRTVIWSSSTKTTIHLSAPVLETATMNDAWESFGTLSSPEGNRVLIDADVEVTARFSGKWYRMHRHTIGGDKWPICNKFQRFSRWDPSKEERRMTMIGPTLAMPLVRHNLDVLASLLPSLGMSPMPKIDYVPPEPWQRDEIPGWEITELNAYWETLMIVWEVCERTIPHEVAHALCLNCISTDIVDTASGVSALMETGMLEETNPHLEKVPLLLSYPEKVENMGQPQDRIIELNRHSYGYIEDERPPIEILEDVANWVINWTEPVRHLHYGEWPAELWYEEMSPEEIYEARCMAQIKMREVENFIKLHMGTIEHIREFGKIEVEGLVLPQLKTYCALNQPDPDETRPDLGPSLQMLRTATELEQLEMPLVCWLKLYGDVVEESVQHTKDDGRSVTEPEESHSICRFAWPSPSRRIICCDERENLLRLQPIREAIVGLDIQFMVLSQDIVSSISIFNCYELVYTLSRIYSHKLRVFAPAVRWWNYPWDVAITELTSGDVTEETWVDLQLAHGRDVQIINTKFSHITAAVPHFGETTGSSDLNSRPPIVLGLRGHHILSNGEEDGSPLKLRNLSARQRASFEKWYRQLRDSIPSDFCSLTLKSYVLGSVPPHSRWLIELIKNRHFSEISRWISIPWVPIMDFTKFSLCE